MNAHELNDIIEIIDYVRTTGPQRCTERESRGAGNFSRELELNYRKHNLMKAMKE